MGIANTRDKMSITRYSVASGANLYTSGNGLKPRNPEPDKSKLETTITRSEPSIETNRGPFCHLLPPPLFTSLSLFSLKFTTATIHNRYYTQNGVHIIFVIVNFSNVWA